MNFCGQCGSALTGRFCGNCGWSPEVESNSAAPAATPDQAETGQPYSPDYATNQDVEHHDAIPDQGTWGYGSPHYGGSHDATAMIPSHPAATSAEPTAMEYRYEEAEPGPSPEKPRSKAALPLALALVVALLLVGAGVTAHLLGYTDRFLGDELETTQPARADTEGATAPEGDEGEAGEEAADKPTDEPTDEATEESTEEPTEDVTEEPYPAPITDPFSAFVEYGSEGRSCETDNHVASPYGTYAYASCRTWQDTEGLLTGEPLAKGDLHVACQANLDLENPTFTEGQENTWWFWAESDAGSWDWFPETALSQGATMQPVNGVAHCEF